MGKHRDDGGQGYDVTTGRPAADDGWQLSGRKDPDARDFDQAEADRRAAHEPPAEYQGRHRTS